MLKGKNTIKQKLKQSSAFIVSVMVVLVVLVVLGICARYKSLTVKESVQSHLKHLIVRIQNDVHLDSTSTSTSINYAPLSVNTNLFLKTTLTIPDIRSPYVNIDRVVLKGLSGVGSDIFIHKISLQGEAGQAVSMMLKTFSHSNKISKDLRPLFDSALKNLSDVNRMYADIHMSIDLSDEDILVDIQVYSQDQAVHRLMTLHLTFQKNVLNFLSKNAYDPKKLSMGNIRLGLNISDQFVRLLMMTNFSSESKIWMNPIYPNIHFNLRYNDLTKRLDAKTLILDAKHIYFKAHTLNEFNFDALFDPEVSFETTLLNSNIDLAWDGKFNTLAFIHNAQFKHLFNQVLSVLSTQKLTAQNWQFMQKHLPSILKIGVLGNLTYDASRSPDMQFSFHVKGDHLGQMTLHSKMSSTDKKALNASEQCNVYADCYDLKSNFTFSQIQILYQDSGLLHFLLNMNQVSIVQFRKYLREYLHQQTFVPTTFINQLSQVGTRNILLPFLNGQKNMSLTVSNPNHLGMLKIFSVLNHMYSLQLKYSITQDKLRPEYFMK